MRKIIFLDVDGVLNSHRTLHRIVPGTCEDLPCGSHLGFYGMTTSLLKNLEILVRESGAEIVLSSTWRVKPGLAKTYEVMRRRGYRGPAPIGSTSGPAPIGSTSDGYVKSLSRGDEIREWLEANGPVQYVILDDTPDGFDGELAPHFVRTYMRKGGLTKAKVEEALVVLRREGVAWTGQAATGQAAAPAERSDQAATG